MNRSKWTSELEAKLIELFPYKTNVELAVILGLGRKTIKEKAMSLNLKKEEGIYNRVGKKMPRSKNEFGETKPGKLKGELTSTGVKNVRKLGNGLTITVHRLR